MPQSEELNNTLENLSLDYIGYLTCPSLLVLEEGFENPFNQVLLECWYWVVSQYFPNGMRDHQVLYDCVEDKFLSVPATPDENITDQDILSLNYYSKKNRVKIVKEYKSLTGNFLTLQAQTRGERPKHYAPKKITTEAELIEYSIKKKNVGILLPPLSEEIQLQIAWLLLETKFRMDLELQNKEQSEEQQFWGAWDQSFGNPHFFIYFNALTKVGVYKGEWMQNLCFDISLHGNRLHCYPIQDSEIVNVNEVIALDDLQGIFECFINQTNVNWLSSTIKNDSLLKINKG